MNLSSSAMRTLWISLGAILCIGIIFFFNRQLPIRNLDSSGTTIVAFGDSLIYGVGATQGHDVISLLSQKIGQPIINKGVSGNTTADGLARIDLVLADNPKIVILLLGGNDYLRKVPLDTTFANLGTIIEKIHAHGSAVLLLGVRGGLLRDTYGSHFEELAEKYQTGFVPNVLDDLIGTPELMADTIHPNDKGYIKMAEKIELVLRRMLRGD